MKCTSSFHRYQSSKLFNDEKRYISLLVAKVIVSSRDEILGFYYDHSIGQNLDKVRTRATTWSLSRSRLRETRVLHVQRISKCDEYYIMLRGSDDDDDDVAVPKKGGWLSSIRVYFPYELLPIRFTSPSY